MRRHTYINTVRVLACKPFGSGKPVGGSKPVHSSKPVRSGKRLYVGQTLRGKDDAGLL